VRLRSVRARAAVAVAALAVLLVTTTGLFLVVNARQRLEDQLEEDARLFASLATRPICESYEVYFESGFYKFRQFVAELLEQTPDVVAIEVLDVEGRILFDSRRPRGETPDLPVVFGDRARLREVLQNLLDNAAKFMGDQPEPRIEAGWRGGPDGPVLTIRDNGIGIEPRHHDRVFGLFDHVDPSTDGTGLGLALVRRVIEMHEGRVWVESEGRGHGSTFCFTVSSPPVSGDGVGTSPS
jgi:signal transduction histidine kinase